MEEENMEKDIRRKKRWNEISESKMQTIIQNDKTEGCGMERKLQRKEIFPREKKY